MPEEASTWEVGCSMGLLVAVAQVASAAVQGAQRAEPQVPQREEQIQLTEAV